MNTKQFSIARQLCGAGWQIENAPREFVNLCIYKNGKYHHITIFPNGRMASDQYRKYPKRGMV